MPEKATNQIPRELRDSYEKGISAVQRNNLDYALAIFTEILQKEPAFYECREALRAAQMRKSSGNTSIFKKMMGSASPALAKAQLTLRSNPKDAMQQAEQALNSDANNNFAHKILADAALAMDLPKTAIISLEVVRRNSPKEREVATKLSQAYSKCGQHKKAEAVLAELLRLYPGDPDINMALKNLSASTTMSEGGYDKIGEDNVSYRDILKDKDKATSLEQEARQFKDEATAEKLLDEYLEKLRADPNDLKLARKVAELYAQVKNYRKALSYFKQLSEINGGTDPVLEANIFDLSVKYYDQRIEQLDKDAPDHAEQAANLEGEKTNYILSETVRRAERYPNDMGIRYDLGLLYFKSGKISEAIQEFQKAQKDPHKRVLAISYLAKCFAARGMNDLAAKNLQNIIKEKLAFDDEKKDLIYSLGQVLEKMGKMDEAIEQYKIIYEVDIGYRDVAKKIDDFYSGKG